MRLGISAFGRKTSPCSKGIETDVAMPVATLRIVERHRPARKGLRLIWFKALMKLLRVERHRPARKGLRHKIDLSNCFLVLCRKTSPCSKGIETCNCNVLAFCTCRKTSPCSKGIETLKLLNHVSS